MLQDSRNTPPLWSDRSIRRQGDWGTLFVITTLMVLPSLVCLFLIRSRLAAMLAGARVRLFTKETES